MQTLSIVQEDRISSLRGDIYKYMSDYYYDPLKASKRYWNYLFEIDQDDEVMEELVKLAPLFSSYIAFLNGVMTDILLQKKMLRSKLISDDYYKKFITDVKIRMKNYAPECYYDDEINNKLIGSLDTKEMSDTIDNLTDEYLEDRGIDMIGFIEGE